MENLTSIASIIAVVIVAALTIGLIFKSLYIKATKEASFVRTGLGGEKVIKSGGAIVLKMIHEIIWVNMTTMLLEVSRSKEDALITKDKMRVDVVAVFYLRVGQAQEQITTAAQTLGNKTTEPGAVKLLVEGKFIDALRSVAAQMNMSELHENRANFVQQVQEILKEDLSQNGLELESVSLTGMDQTKLEFFNENNAFDAEGLTAITEQTERRKKERNAIEQETFLEISRKNP